jgi:hypothetical protein
MKGLFNVERNSNLKCDKSSGELNTELDQSVLFCMHACTLTENSHPKNKTLRPTHQSDLKHFT